MRRRIWRKRLSQPDDAPQRLEIRFHDIVNLRPQHFDDDIFPRGQPGLMGLGQGGRAHGLRREDH
jgi:hypothetical protein